MKKYFLRGLFLTTSLTLALSTVSALTISPARAEFTGKPGETIKGEFTLINTNATDEIYYTSVESFDAQGTSGTPNFTTSKVGLPSWLKIANTVTLKKDERIKIPYSIIIPKDVTGEGYFGAIFLSTTPPQTSDSQASVGAKTGMLVMLKIASSEASLCVALTKPLSKGVENSEVLSLQKFLFDKGYLTSKPNGYFGSGTVTAVKKFQVANSLSPVGSVGAVTRAKVKEVSCHSTAKVNVSTTIPEPTAVDTTGSGYTLDSMNIMMNKYYPNIKDQVKSCANTTLGGRLAKLGDTYTLTKEEYRAISLCVYDAKTKSDLMFGNVKATVLKLYPDLNEEMNSCLNTVPTNRTTSLNDTDYLTSDEYNTLMACVSKAKTAADYKLENFKKSRLKYYPEFSSEMNTCVNTVFGSRIASINDSYSLTREEYSLLSTCFSDARNSSQYKIGNIKKTVTKYSPDLKDSLDTCLNTALGSRITTLDDNYTLTADEIKVTSNCLTKSTYSSTSASSSKNQSADSRNASRISAVNTILNAVTQYLVDNNGVMPSTITLTPTEICATTATTCVGFADLKFLTKNGMYLTNIPRDSQVVGGNGTAYLISKNQSGRITVTASFAELGSTISVTR